MAVGYWIKLSSNPKKLAKSLLIIIILALLGVVLYKLFASKEEIENFDVGLKDNIFGNYINCTPTPDTVPGSYNCNLGDIYRIETIVVGGLSDGNKFIVSYNNNGKNYELNENISNGIKTDVKNTEYVKNTEDGKVYTNSLKFKLLSPTSIKPPLVIKIYGMKMGDYEKDYYTNQSAGNTTFTNDSTSDYLTKQQDNITNSIYNHYFKITKTPTDPENRLIKGIKYKLDRNTSLPLPITVQYANTISNTIYSVYNESGSTEQQFYLDGTEGTIFFSVPVLANILILRINNADLKFKKETTLIGKNPDDVESNTYSVPEYVRKNIYTSKCPSVDIIANNQNLTQRLCDDIENQDKIRIEQIKLDKEKQYLIKLKKQDEQITN